MELERLRAMTTAGGHSLQDGYVGATAMAKVLRAQEICALGASHSAGPSKAVHVEQPRPRPPATFGPECRGVGCRGWDG